MRVKLEEGKTYLVLLLKLTCKLLAYNSRIVKARITLTLGVQTQDNRAVALQV